MTGSCIKWRWLIAVDLRLIDLYGSRKMIAESDNFRERQQNHVVFIHGLAAHRVLFVPMAWQIRKLGFSTSTFGYRSWLWSIEHHAKCFTGYLEKLESNSKIKNYHIVAHSMGGIVTRQAILDRRFEKLKRIVMLGAPNHGSPVAKAITTVLPFLKTLRQISNHSESFVNRLPQPQGPEIGIVAASYDFVIPEPNTHLATESDHVSIFSGHNGLLIRPAAVKQIGEFLVNGQFLRASSTS